MLLEVHGQHETVGLLDAVTHRPQLDAYGRTADELAKVGAAWSVWRAARTAAEDLRERAGRAIGLVTSGVVVGILAARFVAGLLADMGGWRSVYFTSAGLMLLMGVLRARMLPRDLPVAAAERYGASVGHPFG